MPNTQHYKVDYLYHGAYKTFYVRADLMNNSEAWHWAAVDAASANFRSIAVIGCLRSASLKLKGLESRT